ncbi:MAG: nucleoside triphosphate pyrophosphohydrolase [Spirochaetales bacterium]|nr:nucleoside triphosphate pyrophosphohydrolase [Spirochaetales bacterium]
MKKTRTLTEAFQQFYDIIIKLRGPDGCPWDKKQTGPTMRMALIEEAYEVIEAIEKADEAATAEELGDLLLNIALIARIKEEEGAFTFQDVLSGISEKLIRRHPHVFGDVEVKNVEEVLKNWDQIKKQEKVDSPPSSLLDHVPASFPPLEKAYELQKKASKVGFDWKEALPAWEKVQEEISEIHEAIAEGDESLVEEEMGDLFFSLINASRLLKINPTLALNRANLKFSRRFRAIEDMCREKGLAMESMSLEELDSLWDQVKAEENNKT